MSESINKGLNQTECCTRIRGRRDSSTTHFSIITYFFARRMDMDMTQSPHTLIFSNPRQIDVYPLHSWSTADIPFPTAEPSILDRTCIYRVNPPSGSAARPLHATLDAAVHWALWRHGVITGIRLGCVSGPRARRDDCVMDFY